MSTSQDKNWKERGQASEAAYAHKKEQEQLAALRASSQAKQTSESAAKAANARDQDFEGGFGGQEDLEDRYATTSGEH